MIDLLAGKPLNGFKIDYWARNNKGKQPRAIYEGVTGNHKNTLNDEIKNILKGSYITKYFHAGIGLVWTNKWGQLTTKHDNNLRDYIILHIQFTAYLKSFDFLKIDPIDKNADTTIQDLILWIKRTDKTLIL